MFYLECSRFAYGSNDVEANGSIYAEVFDISIGSYDNMPYFLPVDSILRFDVIRVAACFYFYND